METFLGATGVIAQCEDSKRQWSNPRSAVRAVFQHEIGRFNLETIPESPWELSPEDFLDVEANMRFRRDLIDATLGSERGYFTIGNFPRLGAGDGPLPEYDPLEGSFQHSHFLKDDAVHLSHLELVANIRRRRGKTVNINVPIFRDEKTQWPFLDPTVSSNAHRWLDEPSHPRKNHIYADSMLFAHGSCSLQVTVQAADLNQARILHDQLIPLGPIMLALTAATPLFKGYVADTDTRWLALQEGCDDRTAAELETGKQGIPQLKPRCASNSAYISQSAHQSYQDPNLVINPVIKQRFLAGGMDDLLVTYFANIFVWDHLAVTGGDQYHFDI